MCQKKIVKFFFHFSFFSMKFSNSEYADFVFYYGKADGNSLAAQRMYAEAFFLTINSTKIYLKIQIIKIKTPRGNLTKL